MRGRVRPVPPQMLENMPADYEDEAQYSERAALAEAKARLVAFFDAWLDLPLLDRSICAALIVGGGDIQDAARRCDVTYWRCARARTRLMANPTIAEVLRATGGAVLKGMDGPEGRPEGAQGTVNPDEKGGGDELKKK